MLVVELFLTALLWCDGDAEIVGLVATAPPPPSGLLQYTESSVIALTAPTTVFLSAFKEGPGTPIPTRDGIATVVGVLVVGAAVGMLVEGVLSMAATEIAIVAGGFTAVVSGTGTDALPGYAALFGVSSLREALVDISVNELACIVVDVCTTGRLRVFTRSLSGDCCC